MAGTDAPHASHMPAGHGGHGSRAPAASTPGPVHDRHAGHTPAMFRDRFWVCLLLTVPVLFVSEDVRGWFGFGPAEFPGSAWVEPVLGSVIYLYGAGPFLTGAVRELQARAPGMMSLVATATTAAYAYSLTTSFGLAERGFYWELATLIDVMLLGHWLELLSVQGAGRALEHLAALMPPVAHRVRDGHIEDVPATGLRDGDIVLVRPGEQAPADGAVVEGSSTMNEAFLTGESRPVPKGPGSEVAAGAVNNEGALLVRVARTGEDTALGQMIRLVREAQASPGRYQALADRAAFLLTLIAIGVGAITLVTWLVASGATTAVERSVTVLVIACPHALGLAVPLVMVNASAMAARNGILLRVREAFDRAREVRIVAFDKTGTLTEGRFVLRQVHSGMEEGEAFAIAASLEALSEHPLGAAIVEAARERRLPFREVTDFRAVPGWGVEGWLDGRAYRVGRPEWAGETGVELGRLAEPLAEADVRGETSILLMDDERALAIFSLADKVRESARQAVGQLEAMGVQVAMVTGDAESVAREVARELGIRRFYARVLPEEKARVVRGLRGEGPVAFVGDGINDAPALLEADLGVAVGAGTSVAIESADVVLVESDPIDVVRVLRLARATYSKMVQNLLWAAGYNVVAIPLAAGAAYGWGIVLTPAVGALLMSLSTVMVAVNAPLIRRTRLA